MATNARDPGSRRSLVRCVVIAGSAGIACAPALAEEPSRPVEEVVVTSTPLGGFGVPASEIPGNVQQANSRTLEQARSAGLTQMLNEQMGSVFINAAQNNPLQPDVQFRGFVASPLLGQPQGLAIYQDGVRINDPFGDVVSWALVPEGAISRVDLIPGSNPVFGLNTLGGALSIHTKNGFDARGTRAELMAGSFDRIQAQVETGDTLDERFSYYGNIQYLDEQGWRDASPTRALHLFGDIGWRGSASALDLSVTAVNTDLVGNGPTPVQLLATDRNAIYTSPDRTQNDLTFITLKGHHEFSPDMRLEGVTFYRRSNIESLNGDESSFEECDDDDLEGFVCNEESEELVFDPSGRPILASDELEGATVNRSTTDQDTIGITLQLASAKPLADRPNRLVIGGTIDHSTVDFRSSTELGSLDERRSAIAGGVLVAESFVNLGVQLDNRSVFFTDTLAITPDVHVTLAGRFNDSSIEMRDRLGEALSGTHEFHRFNPAAGITWRAHRMLQFYANYSESNRVPSPVELTCADEEAPCALPNSFLSDPPLKQIVAKTTEFGVRGGAAAFSWHAGAYRTLNQDDIIFISAGRLTNRGYFDNVGDTRRQGIEINLSGEVDRRFGWFAHYTWIDAEFRDNFVVASPHNPQSVDGEIAVGRGARIPGVPEHLLKAGARFDLTSQLSVTLDGQYQSNQYFRGDEANLSAPLAGFAIFNAGAEWRPWERVSVFARIENLFDRRYGTFGLFGAPDEVLGSQYDDARFISPAPPLSAWVGVRVELGGR